MSEQNNDTPNLQHTSTTSNTRRFHGVDSKPVGMVMRATSGGRDVTGVTEDELARSTESLAAAAEENAKENGK